MPDRIDHPVVKDDGDEQRGDDYSDLLYPKYLFEGAATLADLSAALRLLADELDQQSSDGWRLQEPVAGGCAHLIKDEE